MLQKKKLFKTIPVIFLGVLLFCSAYRQHLILSMWEPDKLFFPRFLWGTAYDRKCISLHCQRHNCILRNNRRRLWDDEQSYADTMDYYLGTLAHEYGHCMGLPDYYKYGLRENFKATMGDAGLERMDESEGDFCPLSKLLLGWYTPASVQIYQPSDKKSDRHFFIPLFFRPQYICSDFYPDRWYTGGKLSDHTAYGSFRLFFRIYDHWLYYPER